MKIVQLPVTRTPIKLKINLENMPLPVYRRLLVPQSINMMQLHFAIQIAMGWEFAHLFQFSDKRFRGSIDVKIPYDDDFDFANNTVKPEKASLQSVFQIERDAKPFYYEYDFGDGWMHKLTFQKPTKKELEIFAGFPMCVDASGSCPPEDIGGPWGYENFLNIIHDKKHPEYKEYREWLGLAPKEQYDKEYVDLEQINEGLEDLYNSTEWNMTSDDYSG